MTSLESLKPGEDPDRPVHVVFVGAGAVGCFYASRLHHPSHNIHVSLIARSNYKALAESGVHLQTRTFGDYVFRPHAVFPSVAAAAVGPQSSGAGPREWDYIIVTTKALPDRSDDSALIAPLVGPSSCIVLIQNGVGVEQPYRARFPTTPIVSAVTVISAEQTSPGTAIRWHKLCINAAFNPAAVLSGGRGNADMARDAELRRHLAAVMDEIWAAAPRVLGRRAFPPPGAAGPDRILASTERNVGARPSMLLDWDAGRPMELEVILGNPLRIARARGVEMPRLQTVYALLRSMQEVRDGQRKKKKREGKL
ncbi:hypothetical protein VTH06DRAFT_7151 [Thermothelomyces fergusii]